MPEAALDRSIMTALLLTAGSTWRQFDFLWHGQQAFALKLLALQLAGAAHGLGFLTSFLFRRLFVVPA